MDDAAHATPETPANGTLVAQVLASIDEIAAEQWNHLAGNSNPFLRHEFLAALERHGCVGPDSGWQPQHLVVLRDGAPVAAAPLYLKSHSYGEFVFDWGWADAYERAGGEYYPKLLSAVPFTPVPGPRMLCAPGAGRQLREALAGAAIELARRHRVSSLHWLFVEPDDAAALATAGHLQRTGCQYHWRNPGYRDFQDYLDALSSKRRKQVRRERREAAAAPVEIEVLSGDEISGAQWQAYHALYASTYDRKWGYPALTTGFFEEIGHTMAQSVVLILARRGRQYLAGAHLLRGSDALFGRNWGCTERHRALHFEMCYYRGIELCIETGLGRFEAGAQGEHKIMRGFLPVETRSAHWIADRGFREAIAEFLERERRANAAQIAEMATHSPFRRRGEPVAGAAGNR
jgi:predicted N-acyltransferase